MQLPRIAFLAALAVSACASKDSPYRAADVANDPQTTTVAKPVVAPMPATKSDDNGKDIPEGGKGKAPERERERKLIRTGRVEIVVAGYDDARAKLEALVAAAGGFVDSTQVARGQGTSSTATIVVRVPAATFATFIPKLRELGDVRGESTSGQDITDEYVDVAARLASARTLEKRLLELASARQGTIDQVLAVERELARVRGEIEGYEGHIRQWDDRVALATLAVEMSTKQPEIAAASTSLGDRIAGGFRGSIAALRGFGEWLAVTGIALAPWLVLIVPGLVIGRRLARRVRLPFAIAKRPPSAP
jgi:hypothetical protein